MGRNWIGAAIIVLAGVMTLANATPPPAESVVPTQQSECEIQANKYVAQHPHLDPDWFMKTGFFPFGSAPPPKPPWTYRDPPSGITFYVESDGRHLVAIDSNGRLLWVRNPFVEQGMCPYRSAHPYIAWIGPAGGYPDEDKTAFDQARDTHANEEIVKELGSAIERGMNGKRPEPEARFIGLWFNSSQQGYVDISNGDFYWMGQN